MLRHSIKSNGSFQSHLQFHCPKILPSIRSTSLKSPICTRKRSGCTAAFVHSGKTQVTLESNRSTTSSRNPRSWRPKKCFRAEWGTGGAPINSFLQPQMPWKVNSKGGRQGEGWEIAEIACLEASLAARPLVKPPSFYTTANGRSSPSQWLRKRFFSRWIEEPCSIVFVPWTKDKGQCTKHIWITFGCCQQAWGEGKKEFGGSAGKYLFGQKQVSAKPFIKQVEIGCDEVRVHKML